MLRRVLLTLALVLLTGLPAVLFHGGSAAAANLPADFVDRPVTSVGGPIALAFTPDGRLLITTKSGQLRVHEEGASGTAQALDISDRVCDNSERGMLGVAVDPDFAENHYVYLYYTYKKHGVCPLGQPGSNNNPVNRVARYVLSDDNVATFDRILIDNIPSPNGNHNAGDLHFGKDGYLYISVGDGACDYAQPQKCQTNNDAARDRNILLGKVLRIDRDGGIPPGNPYTGSNSARCGVPEANGRTLRGDNCKETFAWGLRNPFRMAFDPDATDTSFRINDVGAATWEEVNRGQKGADYGWNCREAKRINSTSGKCDPAPKGMVKPIHRYNHDTGCSSITGGAFVPDGAPWPASYDDAYLFGDFACGKVFKLTPKARGGFESKPFATGMGRGPVSMIFGPSGSSEALYYTTFDGGGQVRRISYVTENKAPVADVSATPTFSATVPMEVDFDGGGSSDPDGDPLTYEWDFTDDGTVDATGAGVAHTYQAEGTYTATLEVTDDEGASDTAEVRIDAGNTPPTPQIEAPTPGTLFEVGEEFTLRGSAADDEDGELDDSSLTWEVVRHHSAPNEHTHPYLPETPGNGVKFTAPAPEDLLSTDPTGNYLEIRLIATDSKGLSESTSRRLDPRTVDVTFATQPTGFKLVANGETFRAPQTLVSWEGYRLNVDAPSQKDRDGRSWVFHSWSDGGAAARHTIVSPPAPTTYTATFKKQRR